MTIELKDGRYFESIYFLGCDGWDFNGALYKDPGEKWQLVYRFRYYRGVDGGPDDARDKKNWYHVKCRSADATEIAVVHGIMHEMLADVPKEIIVVPFCQIDVRTDDQEEVLRTLLSQPWCHVADDVPRGQA